VATHGAQVRLFDNPRQAVDGVDAIYTDVWTSMGQEAETAARLKAFDGFQVTGELIRHAAARALFLHCLPAHRGEEVSDEVMESPASVVFDQAENRLHAQKALLYMLMAEESLM
jgi:ornithine carbamoyltransferase